MSIRAGKRITPIDFYIMCCSTCVNARAYIMYVKYHMSFYTHAYKTHKKKKMIKKNEKI